MLRLRPSFIIGITCVMGIGIGIVATLFTPLRYTEIVVPPARDIKNVDFSALYEKNPDHYLFIDVRDQAAFASGHPKGAINVPLAQLYTARATLPKKDKEIVLICGGNSASGVGFSYLQHYGFSNIARVPGGYREWLLEGLPIETGTSSSQQ